MGLDMYLYGVKSEYHKHDYNIGHVKNCTQIGYWRKDNQIHKWFVDNVQRGVDNCAIYDVSEEQLKELRLLCEEVLENNDLASEVLPTESGFFFGGTEYDEYYYEGLKTTIEIIDWALSQGFDYFEYESSW